MSRLRKMFGVLVVSLFLAPGTSWAISFVWVCDNPGCNGDAGFSAFLDLSDAAVAAGDFTGVAGNILSAGVTSGIGNGFSLTLSDMLTGPAGSPEDDVNHIRIVLNAARTEIAALYDISSGTNITFFRSGVGRVDFLETGETYPYFVQFVQDLDPSAVSLPGAISGRFVRNDVSRVPEPGTMLLLGSGLAGFAAVRRWMSA